MLVIEIDGNSHEFKYEYDAKRQGRLEKYGLKFIRFTDAQIKNEMFSVLLMLNQTIEILKKDI
jgi:very-short-patch-repair endonuclease